MDKLYYLQLKLDLISKGYGNEIDWIANIQPCVNAHAFSCEAVWVILNSGMKEQIARQIWQRIQKAWGDGKPTASAFGHKGKVDAINYIRGNKDEIFNKYQKIKTVPEQLEFLQELPFIGGITKYHLAKNLGIDCCKPDRHLVRLAMQHKMIAEEYCEMISRETGDKVSMVDMVLWRSANLGWI